MITFAASSKSARDRVATSSIVTNVVGLRSVSLVAWAKASEITIEQPMAIRRVVRMTVGTGSIQRGHCRNGVALSPQRWLTVKVPAVRAADIEDANDRPRAVRSTRIYSSGLEHITDRVHWRVERAPPVRSGTCTLHESSAYSPGGVSSHALA
jgi:hypothetical protein